MGIGITQEQRALAEAVRGWVARTVPPEEVRKLLDTPPQTGSRPAYWDGLLASGLLEPHLEGGTLLDLAVAVEEAARRRCPGRTCRARWPPYSWTGPGPNPSEGGSEPSRSGPGT